MFTRLFRPRWEHSDPQVRRKAFESGDVPPEALVAAARSDADPEVRECAVARLEDLDLLAELASSDPLARIRGAADLRQRALLAGPPQEGPTLDMRLNAIRGLESPELCAFLAGEAQLAEVRAAALERVRDTDLLCALAVEAPVAAVRRAALERIEEPRGWDFVARNARNKDKQISRMARERLDAFHKARSAQETAEQLCRSLEALAQGPATAGTRAAFQGLLRQWEALQCPLPASLTERFEGGGQAVAASIESFESLGRRRRAICAELEDLLGALCDGPGQDAGSPQRVAEALPDIVRRWELLGHEAVGDDALAKQFADLVKRVQRESERLLKDNARAERRRALMETARAVLDDAAELDERQVKDCKRRWSELEAPESKRLAEALQQQFDSLLHAMRERLAQQIRRREQALEEAETFLAELEQVLSRGELEQALSLRDRIRHRLKTGRGVDEAKRAALQRRLHAIYPQLENLRDWRHWGSGQSRERLCSEMEALADAALGTAEIATRVRTAREAWKHIDRAEGPADEALWRRFDAACTRAYAPYQEERRERMAQLEAHQEQKQALCAVLETMERDTDWKAVDWGEADRRVRSLRQRWRRIGPVPSKAVKSLEQRYRAALQRLDSHLERERERELRRRRALVARVEALADAADSRAAAREVKQAQHNWKPTVQADRRTEQALWKQFRTACDAVFKRISAERDATERERQANLERKQALCEELRALLDDASADVRTVTRRFAEVGDEWAGIGPVPRKAERAVAARYEALQQDLAQRQRRAARAAAESALEGIRARARLCERLETALLGADLDQAERQALVEQDAGAWDRLAPLEEASEAPLRERFALASRALVGDAEARRTFQATLEPNRERCLELCLEMEIEAGVDSPADFAEARMQLQVSRLEDVLKHRQDAGGPERLRALQIAWYQVGPLPESERQALQARFARALEAIQER